MKKILFCAAIAVMALSACGKKTTAKTYDFTGKTLRLIELAGEKYDPASTMRAAEMVFDTKDHFAGNTGCNLFNGGYYVNADTLRFSENVAMTRMMCDETSNNVERAMTALISEANRYVVEGDRVSIFNGDRLLGVFGIVGAAPAGCCQKGAVKAGCCKKDSTVCPKDSAACARKCVEKRACCKKDSAACVKKCEKKCQKVCTKGADNK